VRVKMLDGREFVVCAARDDAVARLKQLAASGSGVPAERQRLIFRGRVLLDHMTLAQYDVQNNHVVHLVVRDPTASPSSTPEQQQNPPQMHPPQPFLQQQNSSGTQQRTAVRVTINQRPHAAQFAPSGDPASQGERQQQPPRTAPFRVTINRGGPNVEIHEMPGQGATAAASTSDVRNQLFFAILRALENARVPNNAAHRGAATGAAAALTGYAESRFRALGTSDLIMDAHTESGQALHFLEFITMGRPQPPPRYPPAAASPPTGDLNRLQSNFRLLRELFHSGRLESALQQAESSAYALSQNSQDSAARTQLQDLADIFTPLSSALVSTVAATAAFSVSAGAELGASTNARQNHEATATASTTSTATAHAHATATTRAPATMPAPAPAPAPGMQSRPNNARGPQIWQELAQMVGPMAAQFGSQVMQNVMQAAAGNTQQSGTEQHQPNAQNRESAPNAPPNMGMRVDVQFGGGPGGGTNDRAQRVIANLTALAADIFPEDGGNSAPAQTAREGSAPSRADPSAAGNAIMNMVFGILNAQNGGANVAGMTGPNAPSVTQVLSQFYDAFNGESRIMRLALTALDNVTVVDLFAMVNQNELNRLERVRAPLRSEVISDLLGGNEQADRDEIARAVEVLLHEDTRELLESLEQLEEFRTRRRSNAPAVRDVFSPLLQRRFEELTTLIVDRVAVSDAQFPQAAAAWLDSSAGEAAYELAQMCTHGWRDAEHVLRAMSRELLFDDDLGPQASMLANMAIGFVLPRLTDSYGRWQQRLIDREQSGSMIEQHVESVDEQAQQTSSDAQQRVEVSAEAGELNAGADDEYADLAAELMGELSDENTPLRSGTEADAMEVCGRNDGHRGDVSRPAATQSVRDAAMSSGSRGSASSAAPRFPGSASVAGGRAASMAFAARPAASRAAQTPQQQQQQRRGAFGAAAAAGASTNETTTAGALEVLRGCVPDEHAQAWADQLERDGSTASAQVGAAKRRPLTRLYRCGGGGNGTIPGPSQPQLRELDARTAHTIMGSTLQRAMRASRMPEHSAREVLGAVEANRERLDSLYMLELERGIASRVQGDADFDPNSFSATAKRFCRR